MGAQIPREALDARLRLLPPTPSQDEPTGGLFQRLLANTVRIERDATAADYAKVRRRFDEAMARLREFVDLHEMEFRAVLGTNIPASKPYIADVSRFAWECEHILTDHPQKTAVESRSAP